MCSSWHNMNIQNKDLRASLHKYHYFHKPVYGKEVPTFMSNYVKFSGDYKKRRHLKQTHSWLPVGIIPKGNLLLFFSLHWHLTLKDSLQLQKCQVPQLYRHFYIQSCKMILYQHSELYSAVILRGKVHLILNWIKLDQCNHVKIALHTIQL